jgi:hypothetical protein
VPHFETANDSADDEYDTQRYIFCSRAYMFDAAVRRPPRAETPATTLGVVSGAELDLPPTMPAALAGAITGGHRPVVAFSRRIRARLRLRCNQIGGRCTFNKPDMPM